MEQTPTPIPSASENPTNQTLPETTPNVMISTIGGRTRCNKLLTNNGCWTEQHKLPIALFLRRLIPLLTCFKKSNPVQGFDPPSETKRHEMNIWTEVAKYMAGNSLVIFGNSVFIVVIFLLTMQTKSYCCNN
ncbi:hypothetical protein CTI12_AA258090 [Artemisia annua]|uniref:Transmembrane protein n=1 Tax=Artemisia annua TaxID=35608 RepID=A0A2U1NJY4_ARTAN|nr:hypothetical protein CTI12_AA258090 [Artemisia annua]